MAWKSYHFRTPLLNGTVAAQFYVWVRAFLVAQGWELHDSGGATIPQWTFTGSSSIANNETVTIDSVVYTFKTTLTPAEGEVLIGGSLAAALDNLKLAINRTDPGTNDGVKYKIAAAHTLWEATTNTDTAQVIQWRGGAGNSVGNIPTLTDTCANMSWAAITVWGTDGWYVYKSRGESGLEPYGYAHLIIDATAVMIRIRAYQYWDAGAHTGTRKNYEASDSFYLSNFTTSQECIISGDKDTIFLSSHANYSTSSAGYSMLFGHFPKRFIPDLIQTTDAIVAGNNVSIPVTDSSKVPGAGGYFQILGLSEGCDKLQVASIPDSTHVIVVNLPRNYASGATIGQPASTFFVCCSSASSSMNIPCPVSYFSDAGLTVTTTGHFTPNTITFQSLNLFYGKYVMTPYFCMNNTLAAIGWFDKGFFFYTGIALWDVACMMNDGSIITTNILATSATSLTIVDNTKSWTPDAFIGKFVVVVGGTGIGQVRKITDNDATTITIGYAWFTTPDGTTTFRIYDTVHRYLPTAPFYMSTAHRITNTETPA
jgi:hypothetical protein